MEGQYCSVDRLPYELERLQKAFGVQYHMLLESWITKMKEVVLR